ncbi:MAG: cation transporter [Propionibacteriales bacterium]|nr:cation transporter [Propionibacteriales bacterium]
MVWMLRLTLPLAGFWLVLSGHYTFLLLSLGALTLVIVTWIAWRTDTVDRAGVALHLSPRLPLYLLWLAKEVFLASVAVSRQVWSLRPALRPAVDLTPVGDMSELSQVIYANSITLTPGTLSLTVDDNGVEVHSLKASDIGELQAGEMHGRVRRLEVR